MAGISNIVQKLWGLCDILRDDGITYYQYVNELTYLLFLKIAQETKTDRNLPAGCKWSDLVGESNIQERFKAYRQLLTDLGNKGSRRVQEIFANPTSLLHHPETLDLLVKRIDELDWYNARKEGFGDLYEGLLQKHAIETRGGAGQYFTPRVLIECMVNIMKPKAGEIIQDPAAGTCGFIVAADAYIKKSQAKETEQGRNRSRRKLLYAVEINIDTHRLALMNTMLHNVRGEIIHDDTLSPMGTDLPKVDVILTNPPFGSKKGSGRSSRDDLPFPTSNKQLAFLQHIYLGLRPGGRAAVILPDNVLFEENVGQEIREDLLGKCNLHTILRLPSGIFYSPGVKTNVLFFSRGTTDKGNTKAVWIYDLRANMPRFGKRTPLTHQHFVEFENVYGKDPNGKSRRKESDSKKGRWRAFHISEIKEKNYQLDSFKWIADESVDSAELPEPEELANDAVADLVAATEELYLLLKELDSAQEVDA